MINDNYKFHSSLKSYLTAYVGKLHVSTFFISWAVWCSFCCHSWVGYPHLLCSEAYLTKEVLQTARYVHTTLTLPYLMKYIVLHNKD